MNGEPVAPRRLFDKPMMRIVKVLASSESDLSISAICRKANLNHSCASKMLDELMKSGLIRCREIGRAKLFYLNLSDRKAELLRELLSERPEGFMN